MVIDKELDANVIMAMRRTLDAIAPDLAELYEYSVIPKTDAREMVLDADRIQTFGNMDAETESYYKNLSFNHRNKLAKKAIPLDLC